ncbi:MMPL family transporter [Ornithinimicrobium sp. INDO-MA30-4]|uniref:MMPL family transporter n=1 Tax=Ornithinimicrobium sp. INDO-MA30-4 TaxID=2908651 RepID=UPI001F22AEEC|nr:MMPL family transporter [Ornithinimicrobium sp. INDO-MA30-4]UJH70243.1 MMPL family transporter [Ornithinimicrobium sp. INDO-MA30-4]
MKSPAEIITGRKSAWIVAVVTFLLALAVAGFVSDGERSPSATDSLPAGYDSTEAVALQERLPEDETSTAIALFTVDGDDITSQLPALQEVMDSVAPEGVTAQVVPSEDGSAAISVLTVPAETATVTAEQVTQLRADLAEEVPDGVTSALTGPAAIQADLAAVFEGANFQLLAVTASVVALLLLVTYRSPFLWLVPLIVVGVGDRVASIVATNVLEVASIPWDESTVGILSVLVFGAGTDYALLLISRYRDELKRHESRNEAMLLALRRTAEAVFASASTVFVGLLTLALSAFPTTRGLGVACAVGILVAAAFALVVLPAVLVLFGRGIFWPLVPKLGAKAITETRSIWRRVGDMVNKRPPAFIIGTLAALFVLSLGVFRVDLGLPTSEQFLDEPESISASARLAESFPAGSSDPTVIVTAATDEAELADLETAIGDVDGIDSVRMSAQAEGVTTFDAITEDAPSSPEARDTILELRGVTSQTADTYVSGSAAQAIDEEEATAADRTLIFPLILGLVLLALIGLLRSFLAPVLLVTTVVITYVAALGLSWVLFTQVFGFTAMDSGTPLLAFIFLVALGVDYNIFLVTRALEEAETLGTRKGMLRALAATGGVITSAGILLAAVFAALGVLPLVLLAQLGIVIFVGVLIDTLVVRTVLVPALALTLGEKFWWPRKIDSTIEGFDASRGLAGPAGSPSQAQDR